MDEITIEILSRLCPRMHNESLDSWVEILNIIECPENFHGLQQVLHTLDFANQSYPSLFRKTFDVKGDEDTQLFADFMEVNTEAYPDFIADKAPYGSMGKRPVFALLYTFSELINAKATHSLLMFLDHYFSHEVAIKNLGKEEKVFRAFRLVYTDHLFERHRLVGANVSVVAEQLESFKKELLQSDEHAKERRMLGYVRELIHFYRLDWTSRTRRRRKTQSSMRAAYQRSNYERVYGTDSLYTVKLIKPSLSERDRLSGVTLDEDFPPISFIKTQSSEKIKPEHEMPNKAVIRDSNKEKIQQRIVQRETKKSHNLTLTSRNVLQQYELNYLLDELMSQRQGKLNGISKRHVRLVILLSLALGRSVEDINVLRVLESSNADGEGFYESKGRWYFKAHHGLTSTLGAQRSNEHLLSAGSVLHIQLPEWLSTPIGQIGAKHGIDTLAGFRKPIIIKASEQLLHNLNKKHHCQISLKRISHHLINYVVAKEETDPVLLECLTGKPSYYTRAPRHYAWYPNELVNRKIIQLYQEIFASYAVADAQMALDLNESVIDEDEMGIGSQFTPKRTALVKLSSVLKQPLQTVKAFDAASDLYSTIKYHNDYTLYTLYMLLSATGYRAVGNPLPTFSLHLARYGALCISDKDSVTTFAHMRVIACAQTLGKQLEHYQSHVQYMARLLTMASPNHSSQYKWQVDNSQFLELKSKNHKLDWFINAKNSKGNDGLFLFFEFNDEQQIKATNAFPKSVQSFSKHLPDLPMNFGRHYLRLHLQHLGVHQELIKFQLGHWVAGENPLELFSSFAMSEAIVTLQPILDDMLNDHGWTEFPSVLTRRRR